MRDNLNLQPRCFIIRGLPGSGKSTLAAEYFKAGYLCLDEDMFAVRGGVYHWNDKNDGTSKDVFPGFYDTAIRAMKARIDIVLTGVFPNLPDFYNGSITVGIRDFATRTIFFNLVEQGYTVWVKTLTGQYGNLHNCPEGVFDDFLPGDKFVARAREAANKLFFLPGRQKYRVADRVMPLKIEISERTGDCPMGVGRPENHEIREKLETEVER